MQMQAKAPLGTARFHRDGPSASHQRWPVAGKSRSFATGVRSTPEILASVEALPIGKPKRSVSRGGIDDITLIYLPWTCCHALSGESDDVLEVPNLRHRLVPRPSPFIKSNNFGGGFGELP
jgi:hypothetical protein